MGNYLTSIEAAQYIGVSDRTIRELCRTRQVEHERLNGRNYRFKQEWLDNYLESVRVRPEPQNLTEKEIENHD